MLVMPAVTTVIMSMIIAVSSDKYSASLFRGGICRSSWRQWREERQTRCAPHRGRALFPDFCLLLFKRALPFSLVIRVFQLLPGSVGLRGRRVGWADLPERRSHLHHQQGQHQQQQKITNFSHSSCFPRSSLMGIHPPLDARLAHIITGAIRVDADV